MSSGGRILGWAVGTLLGLYLRHELSKRREAKAEQLEEFSSTEFNIQTQNDSLYYFYFNYAQLDDNIKEEIIEKILTDRLMEYTSLTLSLILKSRGELAYKILKMKENNDELWIIYEKAYNIIKQKCNELFYIGLLKALELNVKTADEVCYTILAVSLSLYSDLLTYLLPKFILSEKYIGKVDYNKKSEKIHDLITEKSNGLFSFRSIFWSLSELCSALKASSPLFECISKRCKNESYPCDDYSYDSIIKDFMKMIYNMDECGTPIEFDAYLSKIWTS